MSRSDDRLSRREERLLIEAGRRLFADDFPNPERIGCPLVGTLKAMASRDSGLNASDLPVSHLTICSPCFREYSTYRRQAERYVMTRFAIAAAVLIAMAAAAVWLYSPARRPRQLPTVQSRPPLQSLQQVTLDLRYSSPARGRQTKGTRRQSAVLPRTQLDLIIQLPIGSEPGIYDVVMARDGRNELAVRGEARLREGLTEFRQVIDLTHTAVGRYTLRISRPGRGGLEYPISVQ